MVVFQKTAAADIHPIRTNTSVKCMSASRKLNHDHDHKRAMASYHAQVMIMPARHPLIARP